MIFVLESGAKGRGLNFYGSNLVGINPERKADDVRGEAR